MAGGLCFDAIVLCLILYLVGKDDADYDFHKILMVVAGTALGNTVLSVALSSALPPAYVAVAGHDPLRDDGARYAELLADAGVTVELHNAETLVHGYLGYTGVVPAATEATQRGLAALRAALHG